MQNQFPYEITCSRSWNENETKLNNKRITFLPDQNHVVDTLMLIDNLT